MMRLLPSKRVERLTGVDYSILEWVINKTLELNFKREFDYNINIHKSKTHETSYVWLESGDGKYTIHLDCCDNNLRYVISSILHEIRHVLQHDYFKASVGYAYRTYREYYNSAEERDARKFEKLTTPIIRMYEAFGKSKEVFNMYDLGTSL